VRELSIDASYFDWGQFHLQRKEKIKPDICLYPKGSLSCPRDLIRMNFLIQLVNYHPQTPSLVRREKIMLNLMAVTLPIGLNLMALKLHLSEKVL
jgi:hypothetical protein